MVAVAVAGVAAAIESCPRGDKRSGRAWHIEKHLCYDLHIMSAQFLTIRLTEAESRLVTRLNKQTGLTKSALVKQALKNLSSAHDDSAGGGLFELGAAHFGRHGDARRQSAQIKQVVRERLNAKRTG